MSPNIKGSYAPHHGIEAPWQSFRRHYKEFPRTHPLSSPSEIDAGDFPNAEAQKGISKRIRTARFGLDAEIDMVGRPDP